MPKSSVYEVNPINKRILDAARRLADTVVQPAIEVEAKALARILKERPSVVAAAISETLYRLVLREDTTRWLAMVAEQEHGFGVVETRSAIGRLAGYSRPGIERRLALVGQVRAGRHNWSPRELADAVVVARAQQLADEEAEVRHEEGQAEDPETPRS